MAGLHIEKGVVIEVNSRRYTCEGRGPGGSYLFIPHTGRGNRYYKPEALLDEIYNGKLLIVEDSEYFGEPVPSAHFDLSALPDSERDEVLKRHFYMQCLIQYRREGGKLSERDLTDFALATHKKYAAKCDTKQHAQTTKPMSASALRRWFRSWTDSGFKIESLVRDARGNSHSKLTREQEKYLEEAIEEQYLNTGRLTAQNVHTLMQAKINLENRARVESGQKPVSTPHYNTLLAHINRVDIYDRLKSRYNAQYAHKVTREYGITPPVNRHLERVQADHTQLDIYVDLGSKILFRPWLTLILDSYSKAVMGYWISPEPPSSESVMQALRIAVLPKDMQELGGDSTWLWPMYGIPSEMTLDNGKEFHGRDLEMAAAELGFTLNFTPPRKAYYKAQVERKFGEINRKLLSKIPGQVFKYEPEKYGLNFPHLDLNDFKRIFLRWITTDLHRTPNKEGYTPEELWRKSVQIHGTPGSGLSSEYIEMCLSKTGPSRIIHPNGIEFNSLTYNNDWLSRLRNNMTPETGIGKPTAKFKWTASDVGVIWVLDPNTHKYFSVQSKEEYAHNRSLYNHRVILREQRLRRKAKLSDDSYLDAQLAIDQEINECIENKRLKNRKSGAKTARYEYGKPESITNDESRIPKAKTAPKEPIQRSIESIENKAHNNPSSPLPNTSRLNEKALPSRAVIEFLEDDLEI